jgi:CMP-N,N'-diacetyllegionaminic acid synthase
MIADKRVLCIIPARGGSKGVPGKNTRLLHGKPLIAYTVEAALASESIDRVIVSTDDAAIADAGRTAGAEVPFERPASLATDTAGTIDVVLHAMEWVREQEGAPYDIVVLLHATTPLRSVEDIDAAVDLLGEDADSVVSVTEAYRNPYFNMVEAAADGSIHLVKPGQFLTRQSAPVVYDLNSSIYVWWWDSLVRSRSVFGERTLPYVMPRERSVDIDEEMDFILADALLAREAESPAT